MLEFNNVSQMFFFIFFYADSEFKFRFFAVIASFCVINTMYFTAYQIHYFYNS